jgi:hypothetical protein
VLPVSMMIFVCMGGEGPSAAVACKVLLVALHCLHVVSGVCVVLLVLGVPLTHSSVFSLAALVALFALRLGGA